MRRQHGLREPLPAPAAWDDFRNRLSLHGHAPAPAKRRNIRVVALSKQVNSWRKTQQLRAIPQVWFARPFY